MLGTRKQATYWKQISFCLKSSKNILRFRNRWQSSDMCENSIQDFGVVFSEYFSVNPLNGRILGFAKRSNYNLEREECFRTSKVEHTCCIRNFSSRTADSEIKFPCHGHIQYAKDMWKTEFQSLKTMAHSRLYFTLSRLSFSRSSLSL